MSRSALRREVFSGGRLALRFGDQKLNLHQSGSEIAPHAAAPTPGSADLCLLVADGIDEVAKVLERTGVPVELGPVWRTGPTGALTSLYTRDPDGNLVELPEAAE